MNNIIKHIIIFIKGIYIIIQCIIAQAAFIISLLLLYNIYITSSYIYLYIILFIITFIYSIIKVYSIGYLFINNIYNR